MIRLHYATTGKVHAGLFKARTATITSDYI